MSLATHPRRGLYRWLISVSALALVVIALLLLTRGGGRLDAYKAQLRASGERLTIAEVLGTQNTVTNASWDEVSTAVWKLHWPPRKQGQSTHSVRTNAALWTPLWSAPTLQSMTGLVIEWPEARAALDEAADHLAAIHTALERPSLDAGWTYPAWNNPSTPIVRRLVAQALADAAIVELHSGRLDKALPHLHALLALVQLHERGFDFVHQMVRIATLQLATEVIWNAMQVPGWTDADLVALDERLRRPQIIPAVVRTLEMDRASGSLFFSSLRGDENAPPLPAVVRPTSGLKGFIHNTVFMPVWRTTMSRGDELAYLRHAHGWIEVLRDIEAHRSLRQTEPARAALAEDGGRISGASSLSRYFGSQFLLMNYSRAVGTIARAETLRQLTLTAIAAQRHRMRTGRFPGAVSDLVPVFCKEMPSDFFDGRPVRLRRAADGGQLLYSVGTDFRDDGGKQNADIVWPKAE